MKYAIILFTFFICLEGYSQDIRRTNHWYFQDRAGLNFNSGEPVAVFDNELQYYPHMKPVSVSDTNGQLLFYGNGLNIYNRNHERMGSVFETIRQLVSFPKPGSDHLHYIFKVPQWMPHSNYHKTKYAIIDMTMNGGMGGIGAEAVNLAAAWDAAEKIAAVKHRNKQDVWVVTRKYVENQYASFLVTQSGVNTDPVLSDAPAPPDEAVALYGELKISYNKQFLVLCNAEDSGFDTDFTEICKFDDQTGEVDYLYSMQFRDPDIPDIALWPYGAEYSPDSKFLYITFTANIPFEKIGYVYQFDMQYIEDSAAFTASAVRVGESDIMHGIQLASDGKIYINKWDVDFQNTYLAVIHKPWEKGTACDFEDLAVDCAPRVVQQVLPSFLLDHLYRFDFEGTCEGEPFQFTPFFHPEPVDILWNFGDPFSGANNTSDLLNPVHVFENAGTYEVSVVVTYPNGRVEETSREVKVEAAPEPDLGPDISICAGEQVVLDGECGPYFYSWSTGQMGTAQISVSDSGWYWVKARNEAGCSAYDSIYVSHYPAPYADSTDFIISPTTCGGSNGAIRGLAFSGNGPFSYSWKDDIGGEISTSIDLYDLAVGNYTLEVTDNTGCSFAFGPYVIEDAGDVLIDSIAMGAEHCGGNNGFIHVAAVSGLSDMLYYSIDNGNNYQMNEGVFDNLSEGVYGVRVRDSSMCQDVYDFNPVNIEDMPAPQIQDVIITPASEGQDDGSIEIIAVSGLDTIYYSIDNGSSWQVNNSFFSGLSAGHYSCRVWDNYDCDTTFIVEVPQNMLHLQAIAGNDQICPGDVAYVPLMVENFNKIERFRVSLLYNKNIISCQGYTNEHGMLVDSLQGFVFPSEGRIELTWNSDAVSMQGQSKLADLVFESTDPGYTNVEWDGEIGSYYFYDSLDRQVPVDFSTGNILIFNKVMFYLNEKSEICEGEDFRAAPVIESSNGEPSYLWTYPSGQTSSDLILKLENVQTAMAGNYSLLVKDTANCEAEKIVELIVHENPMAAFADYDTLILEESSELDAGSGFLYYHWNTGDSLQKIIVEEEGWYKVNLESEQGCTGADSVYVLLKDEIPQEIKLLLPNAFSPDGDGLNDIFKPVPHTGEMEDFRMHIFNRWGQKVFESSSADAGWDGYYRGELCPAGSYVYIIEYKLKYAKKAVQHSGTVVLVQ